MKVLLAFAGSRGDAQPGTLLGRELAERGHRVTVAVSPNLVEFAAGHGVPAVPFGLDSAELLRAQRDDRRFSGWNPAEKLRAVRDLQRRGFAEAARDLLEIAEDADLLVTGMACEEVAAEIARHRRIPLAAMHFFPILPNRSVPVVPTTWGRRLPGTVNRLSWQALTKARSWALDTEIATLRSEFGASQRAESRPAAPQLPARTLIQAYDIDLFPGLADELGAVPATGFPVARGAESIGLFAAGSAASPGRDSATEFTAADLCVAEQGDVPISEPPLTWGGHSATGSQENPDAGWALLPGSERGGGSGTRSSVAAEVGLPSSAVVHDRVLAEWLRAGEAPVYAGFGSMPVADPVAVERMVREVCRRQGRRVLLTGSMFRTELGPDVAVVRQVDHRAVLPRCAVAIHHGGAGTTAAALRAGVPSVICSVQADQPFWGRQLETLGLGATLPFAELSADRLEQALIRATEPTVMLRASAYGMRFRDDGVARAADVVESLAPPANSALPPADSASLPSGGATIRIGGTR